MSNASVQVENVQGLALRGYGKLLAARFVFLRIVTPEKTRSWLGKVWPSLRYGTLLEERSTGTAMNLAFTWKGLDSLGLEQQALGEFARPFREGLAGDARRSELLGDRGKSLPDDWNWGGRAEEKKRPHLLLLLYGRDGREADELLAARQEELDAGGLEPILVLPSQALPDPRCEHFGFEDGISQPSIRDLDYRAERGDPVAAGELLLGYENEDGDLPPSPTVPDGRAAESAGLAVTEDDRSRRDLGRDGTYLVVRQMEQDVIGFWRFVRAQPGGDDPPAVLRRAAKLVGRWPNGAPLALDPDRPSSRDRDERNRFTFRGEDPDGYRCPYGAHIRRANPRDSLGDDPAASVTEARKHRILRRGRVYGEPVADWPDPLRMLQHDPDGKERGLVFLGLNADIERQFEFLHRRWFNDPLFVRTGSNEVDPIIGGQPGGGAFTVPGRPVRMRFKARTGATLPYVWVRGGEYFFLPSLAALRFLATP